MKAPSKQFQPNEIIKCWELFKQECRQYGYIAKEIHFGALKTVCLVSYQHYEISPEQECVIDAKIDDLLDQEQTNNLTVESYTLLPEYLNLLTVSKHDNVFIQELFNICNLNFKPLADRAFLESVIPQAKHVKAK